MPSEVSRVPRRRRASGTSDGQSAHAKKLAAREKDFAVTAARRCATMCRRSGSRRSSGGEVEDSQLQAEREHLRALLELTNAVTTRDVASLTAAIAPNLKRIVTHDDVALYLLHPAREQMGYYALTARGVGWTDELAAEVRPDLAPFATWLAERRIVDMDVERFDWTGREAICRNVTASGLKRICFVPLATKREVLGFLVLNRRAACPFTADELNWSSQAAAQIAIALENALAFREIATL